MSVVSSRNKMFGVINLGRNLIGRHNGANSFGRLRKYSSSVNSGGGGGDKVQKNSNTADSTASKLSVEAGSSSNRLYVDASGISLKNLGLDEEAIARDLILKYIPGDSADYFDLSENFKRSQTWSSNLLKTMIVYPNFVTKEEEVIIMKEIEPYLSRLHYESSHWDDAIHEYRETERSKWNKSNEKIINRIRCLAFPPGIPQLKLVHILDLAKEGVIKPHIDSIRFCGNTIAGLSLLSDCVMRLRHDVEKGFYCDILLPRRSLYIMKDFSRIEFTHEIMGETDSKFQGKVIERDRRVSIICRNEPVVTDQSRPIDPVFKPLY